MEKIIVVNSEGDFDSDPSVSVEVYDGLGELLKDPQIIASLEYLGYIHKSRSVQFSTPIGERKFIVLER